jgi:cytochrome P450
MKFKLHISGDLIYFWRKANVSGAMIEAGSETTSAMLNNAIIGMLSNPSTIEAAHEELDRVVRSDRTPNFDDEKDLPYMRGIIKVTTI